MDGPRPPDPHRKRRRIPASASAATTTDRLPIRVRADGAGRQGRSASRPCLPRIRPVRALACPDRTSQVAAPTGSSTGTRPAGHRRTTTVRVGAAANGAIGSSRSPGWWRSSGVAGESRSGHTGQPSCLCATGPSGPAAHLPVPTSSRPRGANRCRSLAGRLRKAGRATAARAPPSRSGQGQTATAVSAGSTSVQVDPTSAERVTASSTSWTCNASAKDGAGSVPVAIASMKSRIWWVKECS